MLVECVVTSAMEQGLVCVSLDPARATGHKDILILR